MTMVAALAGVVAGLLAGWLFDASWSKWRSPSEIIVVLQRTVLQRTPSRAMAATRMLCALEAGVAGMLIVHPPSGAALAAALFAAFIFFLARWRVILQGTGCGCSSNTVHRASIRALLGTRASALVASVLIVVATRGIATTATGSLKLSAMAALAAALAGLVASNRRKQAVHAKTYHGERLTTRPIPRGEVGSKSLSRRGLLVRSAAVVSAGFVAPALSRASAALAYCGAGCDDSGCCALIECAKTSCSEPVCIKPDPNKPGELWADCYDYCDGQPRCGSAYTYYEGVC